MIDRARGTLGSAVERGRLQPVRNLVRYARRPLDFLSGLAERHGDVVEVPMIGARPWFMINHPADIEELLIKRHADVGRDEYVQVLRRALGQGLLTSDGELWRRQRKLASAAFTPRRIRTYADAMVRVAEVAIAPWREGQVVNLHEELSRITMEVVAEVLFGASVGARDVAAVRRSMEVINRFFANSPEAILRVPAWFPTPLNRAMNRAVARIDELVFQILEGRRAGPPRDDLLGSLLDARDDDGRGMSDRQLRDETITLFLAGHETTALALAAVFYLLAKHPAEEARLHAELDAVLGGRLPTEADVAALPRTGQVLKEAMRLFPPAWVSGREVTRSFALAGRTLPVGAQILFSQWVVHRDPRWYPDPEAFVPDRWAGEAPKARPRFAYFPFGGGPRVCIGNHFATMEATLLIATIASRFHLELLPNERLELAPSVTLRPRGGGVRVRVRERAAPRAAVDRRADASAAR